MDDFQIFIASKDNIPSKYLPQLFALDQQREKEQFGFQPPSLAYYENAWGVADQYWLRKIQSIAINEEDKLVGFGYLGWNIAYDNLDRCFFDIYISPSFRRKRVGTEMLNKMIEKMSSDILYLTGRAMKRTPGDYFLQNIKQEPNFVEQINVADLRAFNLKKVEEEAHRLHELAVQRGYELKYINNTNFSEYVEPQSFAGMIQQVWNDMPREQLSNEDEIMTFERYLERCKREKNLGFSLHTFIAIDSKTVEPIGYTKYNTTTYQPWIVSHDDTGVIPEYRGKRLGLILKYQALLRILKESQAKYWRTRNSANNIHMNRINKSLGHVLWRERFGFEFKRTEWYKYRNKEA